ncbi:g-patch domain protein [Dictyocaulus viviparus]|uniref:G patch domain-containing protein 11 n=1 Tax=Dictyocaulus viviparus TaxID=29172 RepID=A0A0D8XE06_DICVI|nr:g-patch domain protein [Dictyocaulus viviparus]
MRRVHISHNRSRSRSRSPLLRGPKPVISKSQPVNMLDQAALLALRSKKEGKVVNPKERITCTIDGPRRAGTFSSRMSGGYYGYSDRRRSDGDRSHSGFQNRQVIRDRLSFSDRRGRDRFEASRDRVVESSRFNGTLYFLTKLFKWYFLDQVDSGKFRDGAEEKPVQRLVDPTMVPKGRGYFGVIFCLIGIFCVLEICEIDLGPIINLLFQHDDRGEEKQWRGRNTYDPRIDMGPRRDRLSGFRGYGGRDRYDHNDRDGGPRRQFGPRSAADGIWTHDKFVELEGEEAGENDRSSGVEVIVDQSSDSKSKRLVEEIELNKIQGRREEKAQKLHDIEKAAREEGLSKPVPETSKGFALITKMGFKPGMSLGKKKDGIKEPIPVEVKVCRSGLGHDNEREKQSKINIMNQMNNMKRNAKQHVELISDYRKRKRIHSNRKNIIRDILACRSICVELDLRENISNPIEPWFWKSYHQHTEIDDVPNCQQCDADDTNDDRKFFYANGKEAPEEEIYDDFTDEMLCERLHRITCYLRTAHYYCIWCGCQFRNNEELNQVRVLCVGDLRGQFEQFAKKLEAINKKNGPFDLLLCVGEFFGLDAVENESFLNGKVDFVIPTYVLGPCSSSTSVFYPEDLVEFSSNVTYLGKRGILNSASGLQIAYLSGIEGQSSNSFQFNEDDIEELLVPVRNQAGFLGVDILVTSMWPAEVWKHAHNTPSQNVEGSRLISRLAAGLKPRYHFSGMAIHYERQPYRNHRTLLEPAQHVTRFIGLASLGNSGKQKWLYAFNIQPMRKMNRDDLTKQPPNSSEFPYMDILLEFSAKSQIRACNTHDNVDRYRFDMSAEVEDNVDRGGKKRRKNDYIASEKIPAAPCWFCLSNENAEKHLVVSVGSVCYAAMPKGPLVSDHVMVLSVGHIQSLVAAGDEIKNEVEKYKNSFILAADKAGKSLVCFERNYRTQHMQVQMVPVPKTVVKALNGAFLNAANLAGIEFIVMAENEQLTDLVNEGCPYFSVELPDGSRLFTRQMKNFPLQFAREVLASREILDCEAKVDWRSCVLSKSEETKLVKELQARFKPFDFTGTDDSD